MIDPAIQGSVAELGGVHVVAGVRLEGVAPQEGGRKAGRGKPIDPIRAHLCLVMGVVQIAGELVEAGLSGVSDGPEPGMVAKRVEQLA